MGLDYHASASPLLVLTPDRQHQASYFGNHYQAGASESQPLQANAMTTPTANSTTSAAANASSNDTAMDTSHASRAPLRPRFPRPPSINYLATSEPLSGRKRTIEDVDDELRPQDVDGSYVNATQVLPPSPPKPQGEPILGPGMTLIYPNDPQYNAIAPESQSGTWVEEGAVQAAEAESRPAITSRKSQRRTQSEVNVAEALSAAALAMNDMDPNPPPDIDQPIDKLSVILGVGWKRIPASQAPAAKGWEKYIFNHYSSIDSPSILLHNEGLRVYLVRALSASNDTQECWWVFQEDLSACRLVGHCEEDAIRSLQRNEPISMGPVIHAHAESRPRGNSNQNASAPTALELVPDRDPATGEHAPSGGADMEMDM